MFKSFIAYKYNSSETDVSKINKQIKNKDLLFTELTNFDTFSEGFSCFYDDTFIIESDNRILLKITFSSKTVSNKTVDSLLNDKIEQLKTTEKIDEVSNAVREIYREQLYRECIKYTEPVNKIVYLLIDQHINYIYVSTSNSNIAEDALHLLRKSLGKLVCRQLESINAPLFMSSFLRCTTKKHISEYIVISDYPTLTAVDDNSCCVKLDGISRCAQPFIDILDGLSIKSIDMILSEDLTSEQLASFSLLIGKNGIFIFKKFKYDVESIDESDTTNDSSYFYTSKMLLIGRYMRLIIESFVDFFEIQDDK